jgi:UDP-galactopyranose mutase
MQLQYSIVAFSHLRWNFVYQRPQHLLSRLAAKRPVFFIEEPEFEAGGVPRWERSNPQPNVVVLRPRTPIEAPGFHADQLPALEPLMAELSRELESTTVVAWLYTPMALPLAQALAPAAMG